MKQSLLIPALVFAFATLPQAQDPPFRASLRSSYTGGTSRADVWADGNVALQAHIGQDLVDIIDISDPDDATLLTTWSVPAPSSGASAQDVKAANGLMYINLGNNGANSVEIVDIRVPSSPVHLTWVNVNSLLRPHNIFIDQGWLYLAHGAGPEIAMVDLTGYDPDNPPAEINGATRFLGGLGAVHDITVESGLMYISDIGSGFPIQSGSYRIYDVTNLATQAPTFQGSVEGGLVHSSWPTADNLYSISVDEDIGGPAKFFEQIDTGSSISLVQRDAWVNPQVGLGASMNPHNPVVFENRVYLSNNAGGVIALQIDRTSKTMELVASYDTSTVTPTTYFGEGCWGVYPLLGHDRVLASDRQSGFFVIDFSGLEIAFTSARATILPTGSGSTVDVTIDELGSAQLDASSVQLHTSLNGGKFQTSAMTSTGGNGWQGSFPSLDCGDRLSWYVSAQDLGGETYTRPGQAPDKLYEAYVSDGLVTVFSDDFETNLGWTTAVVGTTLGGEWQRGVPVDNGLQPPTDDPDSPGTRCFVTEIGAGGLNDDVDGGPVRLTSPVMDFAGFDGVISYLRWYLGSDANGIQGEPFLVELSNDGGASWTTAESVPLGGGGWLPGSFRISDVLPPTSQMRVRFSASDVTFDSTVEAGVDNFRAERFECALTLASATFRNGTGVNNACYTSVTTPRIGQVWDATVDTSGHPGATLTQIYLYAQPSTGPVLSYGEVLVNLGSPRFFKSSKSVVQPVNPHTNFIPYDVSFVGATTASQGLILGGGVELCNAVDLVVGF